MHEANLRIISTLKDFLFSISTNRQYRELFCNNPSNFSRKRKLPFDQLALFLVRLCKKTLSVELDDYFHAAGRPSCSTPAFTQQRLKLDPSFFYCWNRILCDSFYKEYDKRVCRWMGYRLIGVDGSNIALVNKPILNEVFGGQSNQTGSFVQAKIFYAYDLLNKLILFPAMTPYRYGEVNSAYNMLMHAPLESDFLMIFDRNFSNYKMVALMELREQPIKYVIRVQDRLNIYKGFVESRKREQIIEITPTSRIIEALRDCGYTVTQTTAIKVRLIRVVLENGKIEVLMTNLWKEEGHSAHIFKELYSKRWGVETNIGFQKNILQLEALSGQTPITIMQDFYATVFTANLHFILIKPSQKSVDEGTQKRKHQLQINNNKAFGKIRRRIIDLFLSSSTEEILRELHDYFIRAPLPVRPGRSYPRIRRNPMSKSKHRMFTNYKPAY